MLRRGWDDEAPCRSDEAYGEEERDEFHGALDFGRILVEF